MSMDEVTRLYEVIDIRDARLDALEDALQALVDAARPAQPPTSPETAIEALEAARTHAVELLAQQWPWGFE